MRAWLSRRGFAGFGDDASLVSAPDERRGSVAGILTKFRARLLARVKSVNDVTAREVIAAAKHVHDIVERSRAYVQATDEALGFLHRDGDNDLGKLLQSQTTLLREHVAHMSEQATLQEQKTGQAAKHARAIADLAMAIERLAGEAKILAVNARIESARLGADSAGFEVLSSEMRRMSDEVGRTNEQVKDLATRLEEDLPWLVRHAREINTSMQRFAEAARERVSATEAGVVVLREQLAAVSNAGDAAMKDVLVASNAALSHLQFQDVVAQELKHIDEWVMHVQVEVASSLAASASELASIPPAEYTTQGGEAAGPAIAEAGEVTLF